MVTLRAVAAGGFIEGSYTSWATLGVITLPHTPMDEGWLACLVDCQNEILYVVYGDGYPTFTPYLTSYQLPGKTLIAELANKGNLNLFAGYGSSHGLFAMEGTSMIASVSGRYICQETYDSHIIVTELGAEIEDITPTINPEQFYISPDGHYIVITGRSSPYQIEVFEGT